MRLRIKHQTRYVFDEPAYFAVQQVRLTALASPGQGVRDWRTRMTGADKQVAFRDQHGNLTELVSFETGATEVQVDVEGGVEIRDTQGIVGPHEGPAPLWLYRRVTPRTQAGAGVQGLIEGFDGTDPLAGLHDLAARIADRVTYTVGASQPDWGAEEAIAAGEGVCQDHAHVFLACARALELPARYVSGYLMMNDRVEQEAMHAWAEAHLDGLGWVGFDPSNGISPDARYVRVATGLDYAEAAPISGTRLGGSGEQLHVSIEVAQQ